MGDILDIEKVIYGGDKIFPNMMAAMSILSDAQHLLEMYAPEAALDKGAMGRANATINHAKEHLAEAMELYHKEKKLPGELRISKAREKN